MGWFNYAKEIGHVFVKAADNVGEAITKTVKKTTKASDNIGSNALKVGPTINPTTTGSASRMFNSINGPSSDIISKSVGSVSKEVAEREAKNVAELGAKSTIKQMESNVKRVASKLSTKDYAKLTALATVTGMGTAAVIESLLNNGTEFQIIDINIDSDNIVITFQNPDGKKILQADTITISGSNTTPSIDGEYNLLSIDSLIKVQIKPTQKINTGGDTGIMTLHTSVANQLGGQMQSLVEGAIEPGMSAILNGIASIFGIDPKTLQNYATYIEYFFIVVLVLVILGTLFSIISKTKSIFSSSNSVYRRRYY